MTTDQQRVAIISLSALIIEWHNSRPQPDNPEPAD